MRTTTTGPIAQSGPEPLLHAERLFKTFGSTEALDGASMSVAPGEVVARR